MTKRAHRLKIGKTSSSNSSSDKIQSAMDSENQASAMPADVSPGRQEQEQPINHSAIPTNNQERKNQPLPFPWNTTELSMVPRQSNSRFTSRAQELFESKRAAAVEQFISEMNTVTRGDQFFREAELEDLLNDRAQVAINSFRDGCGKVHSVDREAEKLVSQLDHEKERFRLANEGKIEGHREMLNEEIIKLRKDFEERLRLLLNREDVVTTAEYQECVQSTRKAVEDFQKRFQSSLLFETINKQLSEEWKTVYPVIKGLIEDHNLGIEMDNMKADVESEYERLTSNVKVVEDLEAAHLEAVKKIEEACMDKEEVYKFADIPIFIEEMKRIKAVELEEKSQRILAELDTMHHKALENYQMKMEEELGVGKPVQQPVLAFLNKKYRKMAIKEFQASFARIQDGIKNAPERLEQCLETLRAKLTETYREFQEQKNNLWTQYQDKVAQALKESEELCEVELLKVGKPNGYPSVEAVLAMAEIMLDAAADLRLFEPRYVSDAREKLRRGIIGTADTATEDNLNRSAESSGSSEITTGDRDFYSGKDFYNVLSYGNPVSAGQMLDGIVSL